MITILNINKYIRENKLKGPVNSPQIFLGKSKNYHPGGLYSEELFGIEGSKDRRKSFSYINLNCRVIHPLLYTILKKEIERKLPDLISGDKSFSLDEQNLLVEDPNGEIRGMTKLYEYIQDIRFRRDEHPSKRNSVIVVIEKNIKQNLLFIDKLLVIPPDYRPISFLEQFNETRVDELSTLYIKIITLSSQLGSVSGILFDILSYRMQLLIYDLFDLIRTRVAKKSGMIRDMMLGRRVDLSARAVVAPNPDLRPGEVGIPFKIICQIFEPYLVYALFNSPFAKTIDDEFYTQVRQFLGKESALGIDI